MREVNESRLKELETIRVRNNGVLKPEQVVEFAKDPNTALHSWFDWDDTEAARKWRIDQARTIIRVMVAPVDGSKNPVRMLVSIMDDRKEPGGGYRSFADTMADPEMRKKMLQTALIEFNGVKKRYEALTELSTVFTAIEEAEKTIEHEPEEQRATA
jgi:hypothetical protein